jgi:hypothetical protein
MNRLQRPLLNHSIQMGSNLYAYAVILVGEPVLWESDLHYHGLLLVHHCGVPVDARSREIHRPLPNRTNRVVAMSSVGRGVGGDSCVPWLWMKERHCFGLRQRTFLLSLAFSLAFFGPPLVSHRELQ